jgi:NADH:ubiquinone oxidoreductase subunit C
MTKEEHKLRLTEHFADAAFDETGQWLQMMVDAGAWISTAERIGELGYDYMFCLTCVDNKTNFTMVYHVESTTARTPLILKVQLSRENPEIETVSHIWRTAEFHEREVYELFGVNFLNHPDLRLLILPDGWEGRNPLRKDYEDDVNMIKL